MIKSEKISIKYSTNSSLKKNVVASSKQEKLDSTQLPGKMAGPLRMAHQAFAQHHIRTTENDTTINRKTSNLINLNGRVTRTELERIKFTKNLLGKRTLPINTSENSINKLKYLNCVKLVFENQHKPEVIFEKMGTLVEDRKILSITPIRNNKTWIVKLDLANSDILNVVGKELNFSSEKIVIKDPRVAEKRTSQSILKFFWLPPGFNKGYLKKFVMDQGIKECNIVSIENEYYSIDGMAHVENGTVRVKISHDSSDRNRIVDISGISFIGEDKCLISVVGAPPRCIFCEAFGHVKKECKIANLRCDECGFLGHLKKDHSLAEKIKSINRLKKLAGDDPLTIDFDIDEPFESNEETNVENDLNRIRHHGGTFCSTLASVEEPNVKSGLSKTQHNGPFYSTLTSVSNSNHYNNDSKEPGELNSSDLSDASEPALIIDVEMDKVNNKRTRENVASESFESLSSPLEKVNKPDTSSALNITTNDDETESNKILGDCLKNTGKSQPFASQLFDSNENISNKTTHISTPVTTKQQELGASGGIKDRSDDSRKNNLANPVKTNELKQRTNKNKNQTAQNNQKTSTVQTSAKTNSNIQSKISKIKKSEQNNQ